MKYFFPLLFLMLFASSCHAPDIIGDIDFTVKLYPDTQSIIQDKTYTFYAVLSPKSSCESFLDIYKWEYGNRMKEVKSGVISVSELRKILPDVKIDDDSYCVFSTICIEQSYYKSQDKTTIRYYAKNSLPYATRYLIIYDK